MTKEIDVIAVLSAVDNGLNSSLNDVLFSLEKVNQSVSNLFSNPIDSTTITTDFNEVKNSFSALNDMLEGVGLSNIQSMFIDFSGVAKSQMEKVTKTFDLFSGKSKKATDKIGNVFNSMGSSLKNIPGNILPVFDKMEGKVSGFTNDVARTISNLAPKTVISMLNMESGVASAMDKIGLKFIDTEIFFESFSEGMSNLTQNVPLLTKSFGGIGSSIQKSSGVGTKSLTTMVQGLSSVFGLALKSLGPTAILGLALAGFGLINSQFGEQLQEMIAIATEKGPPIIQEFIAGIIGGLPSLIASGTQLVAGLAEAISVNLPIIVQSGIALLQTLIDGVIANLPSLINSALLIIETLATSLLTAAPQLLLMGLELLSALVDGLFQDPTKLIDTVTSIIETLTNEITSNLPTIIEKGIEILVKLAEGIASVLPQLIPVALEAIKTLVGALLGQVPELINAAIKIVAALCKGIFDGLPDILLAAGELLLTFIGGIIDLLPDIATAGWKMGNEIVKEITGVDLFKIGGNIIKGLIEGIGSKVNDVINAVKDIGAAIGDKFKSIFNINSPSRWMRDKIGAMLPAGLAIGIERNAHIVDQPMDDLASKVVLPSLDSLDQQVDTVQKLAVYSNSTSTQTQQTEKQPATFNIRLGNQQFKAFVEDISEAMGQNSAINLAF